MSIVDQFGGAIYSRRFAQSANRYSSEREWQPLHLREIDKLIPQYDRDTLTSVSNSLYMNMPLVSGAINLKAKLAIGKAWSLIFTGDNEEWGKEVVGYMNNFWFNNCDVRGGMFNFRSLLKLDSISLDRDGDFAILLTESDTGLPLMQRIRSHRIRSRHAGRIESGKYAGMHSEHGVIKNDLGKPVAYNITGDDASEDRIIDANNIILPYDARWFEQDRGIPSFSPCLNELRDMLQTHQWEQQALKLLSAHAIIEYNDTGDSEEANTFGLAEDEKPMIAETEVFGGMYRHFKAGSGNKVETLKSDRPSDSWDNFQDRMSRYALATIEMPYSMCWKPSGQGTAERSDLEKADRTIQDRQELIKCYSLRIVRWAVAKLVKAGRISEPPNPRDWRMFDFTMPPKISINFKNDSAAMLALHSRGLMNDSDILTAFTSKTTEEHYLQRARNIADRKRIKEMVELESGCKIEDREMIMLTPNEMKELDPDGNKKEVKEDA